MQYYFKLGALLSFTVFRDKPNAISQNRHPLKKIPGCREGGHRRCARPRSSRVRASRSSSGRLQDQAGSAA